jgi:hypothetical protein
MIKDNELRIGNLVSHVDTDSALIIREILEHTVSCNDADGLITNNKLLYIHINPIPLTPEILEQCEFKRDSLGWYNTKNYFKLYQPTLESRILPCYFENIVSDIPVKYLHQLQNLYFALIGKELNYEPKK